MCFIEENFYILSESIMTYLFFQLNWRLQLFVTEAFLRHSVCMSLHVALRGRRKPHERFCACQHMIEALSNIYHITTKYDNMFWLNSILLQQQCYISIWTGVS